MTVLSLDSKSRSYERRQWMLPRHDLLYAINSLRKAECLDTPHKCRETRSEAVAASTDKVCIFFMVSVLFSAGKTLDTCCKNAASMCTRWRAKINHTFCQLQVRYLIAFPSSNAICFSTEISSELLSVTARPAMEPPIDFVRGTSMRFIFFGTFLRPPDSAASGDEAKPS